MTTPQPSVRNQVAALLAQNGCSHVENFANVLAAAGLLRAEPVDGTVTEVEWAVLHANGRLARASEAAARAHAQDDTVQCRTVTHGPWENA